MDQKLIEGLFGIAPVVLSPVIAYLLSHSAVQKDEDRMSDLTKRLDLIARLNQMHDELKDERLKEIFDAELEMCKQQVVLHKQVMSDHDQDKGSGPKSWVSRFFLDSPSRTIKQRVFKGLFYFFFAISILVLSLVLIQDKDVTDLDKSSIIIGSVFYLFLAMLFRAMAKPGLTKTG